jgi:hypothetical protein
MLWFKKVDEVILHCSSCKFDEQWSDSEKNNPKLTYCPKRKMSQENAKGLDIVLGNLRCEEWRQKSG